MAGAVTFAVTHLTPALAAAADAAEPLGRRIPVISVIPFALMLLSIAVLPLVAPSWWHHNKNRALVSLILGLPMATWMAVLDHHEVLHILHEYVAFIVLLGALFVISGGIVVRGTLAGTPGVNTIMLLIGSVLASFIGTTGAAMLLIRPLLRANEPRKRKVHVFIFFIFLVANIGGLLTPLGDPPLFLGFLRGVPFEWTFSLTPQWAAMVATLLIVFYIVDSTIFRREDITRPGDLDEMAVEHEVPLQVAGKVNFLFLGGVVLTILLCGTFKPPVGVQEAGMLAMAILSLVFTQRELRQENQFSWEPIIEVAVVFAGIFATMIPALAILNARGAELGLSEGWQFFWATGVLSSFLDNAPTYLTFTSTASGLVGTDGNNLHELITCPGVIEGFCAAAGEPNQTGVRLLRAISMGAVFMGANTYIGNGPNFMVKAIAEQSGVKMPSFFGYMVYGLLVLIPLFILATVIMVTIDFI
jgi:Na+/H+ antiporter NhaD/arsenite permease-like protein